MDHAAGSKTGDKCRGTYEAGVNERQGDDDSPEAAQRQVRPGG